MITESELRFLQNKNFTGFTIGFTNPGEHLFIVFGVIQNGEITRIRVSNKVSESEGFTRVLCIYEWKILEGFLLSNLPKNCKFGVGGIVKRENGTGNLRVLSTITK